MASVDRLLGLKDPTRWALVVGENPGTDQGIFSQWPFQPRHEFIVVHRVPGIQDGTDLGAFERQSHRLVLWLLALHQRDGTDLLVGSQERVALGEAATSKPDGNEEA